MNGAFRYNASATITSAKWTCLCLSRLIRRFPPVSSPSSFSSPSLGFNISWPRITCGAFPTVIQTTLRWKYSVSPARFFRVRQSGQDFFVLLNNSTPSIPATTYLPMVPSRNTRFFFNISIVSSWIFWISSGLILDKRSLTASTFGIFPVIQFRNRLDILSGAEKTVWKLSYCSIRKSSTGITILNSGIDFLSLWSDKHLIFCGILYTLVI